MRELTVVLFLWACSGFAGCSTKNVAGSYTNDTDEEKARKALDAGDFDKAIEIYEALVADDPEYYEIYPLLSAAIAGRAGIDILNIVKHQFGGEEKNSIFDVMSSFVPENPSDEEISDIQAAIRRLELMPENHRRSDGGFAYGASAGFQYTLYLAASSAMLLNKFTVPLDGGGFDQDKLNSMTEEDVEAILNNLDSLVAGAAASSGSEAVGGQVESTLEEINAQEGSTQKEKLINYLNNRQKNDLLGR